MSIDRASFDLGRMIGNLEARLTACEKTVAQLRAKKVSA